MKRRGIATAAMEQQMESDNQSNMNRSISSGGGSKKHNKNECLLCCRNSIISKVVDTSLIIQESKDVLAASNAKIRDSSDASFYSPESIISDDSANTNMPDRISTVILRNFQKMANPILFKTCRKILMELKQKYPQSFQDICLYSEVCKYMGICNYRMTVRRFIQEIFMDLNFDVFNNDVELILNAARQRLRDQKLLDTSKTFPLSSTVGVQISSSSPSSQSISLSHKLHSIKSPLLASVHESSIENLIDPPKSTKDEVDSVISNTTKNTIASNAGTNNKSSPGSSQKVTAEIHSHKLKDTTKETSMQPIRRRRFNTLELDLSCTKNKFPIKHRSPTTSSSNMPSSSSSATFERRPLSLSINSNNKDGERAIMTKNFSTSDHSFESPISPLGPLYCEQRLLQSRSEATLNNNDSNNSNTKDKGSDDRRRNF